MQAINRYFTVLAKWMAPNYGSYIDNSGLVGSSLSPRKLTTSLKLWWHPPSVKNKQASLNPDSYHTRRLFLWAPRMKWTVNFYCPMWKQDYQVAFCHQCGTKESLWSKFKVCIMVCVQSWTWRTSTTCLPSGFARIMVIKPVLPGYSWSNQW